MKGKRILSMLLCALMLCAVFAGCGKKGGATEFTVLEDTLAAEEYGIGFRKEDYALGMKVQQTLDEMIEDGKFAEISKKWFGEDKALKDAEYYSEVEATDGSWDKVKEAGELVMGLDDSFPPMGYRDDENNIVGFDIDLATEVCSRLGVELKLQPIDWDSKELELSSGAIDCIWNGMSVNDERLEAMFIPKAYIANKQIISVPADSDIKTKDDLKDKVVGLQKGSTALDALMADPIHEQVKEIPEYPDNVAAFMDLQTGRIDALVIDEVVGYYMMETGVSEAE